MLRRQFKDQRWILLLHDFFAEKSEKKILLLPEKQSVRFRQERLQTTCQVHF